MTSYRASSSNDIPLRNGPFRDPWQNRGPQTPSSSGSLGRNTSSHISPAASVGTSGGPIAAQHSVAIAPGLPVPPAPHGQALTAAQQRRQTIARQARGTLVWDENIKNALLSQRRLFSKRLFPTSEATWEGIRILLRSLLPAAGALSMSYVGLDASCPPPPCPLPTDKCLPAPDAVFANIFQGGTEAKLIAGTVMLASPLLERAIWRMQETPWKIPGNLTPAQKKDIRDAVSSFTGQMESLASIIISIATANHILATQSGVGPAVSSAVGTFLNLILAFGENVKMHMDADARGVLPNLRSGNAVAIKNGLDELGRITNEARYVFAGAGVLGLGGTATAAIVALTQFEGQTASDKTNWFVQSFLPALACLYTLGSSLLSLTLQLHQSPPAFIKAKVHTLPQVPAYGPSVPSLDVTDYDAWEDYMAQRGNDDVSSFATGAQSTAVPSQRAPSSMFDPQREEYEEYMEQRGNDDVSSFVSRAPSTLAPSHAPSSLYDSQRQDYAAYMSRRED